MARRQANVKPEDIIKILEEKFSEFREETLKKLSENERANENILSGMNEAKQTSKNEFDQLREAVENKKNEEKFSEFREETCKKLSENERAKKNILSVMNEEKQTSKNEFDQLRKAIENIDNDIQRDILKKAKKSVQMHISLTKEISKLIEEKIGCLKWELTAKLNSISEVLDFQEMSSSIILKQLEEHINCKMRNIRDNLEQDMKKMSSKAHLESTSNIDTKEQIACLAAGIDEINEKLYDFEASKRNNLIFYGITGDTTETPVSLQAKVSAILKKQLMLKRYLSMTAVARMMTGPEVAGCRPVLVTFEEFKDREDVLRKAALLRGSQVQVTEDMSRRVRESRCHLRKFMKDLKSKSPGFIFSLQYDRLYVEHKCFVWSDVQRKVVQYYPGIETEYRCRSLSPLKSSNSRSSSVDKEGLADIRNEKIEELEEEIKKLKRKLEACDRNPDGKDKDNKSATQTMCIFTSMRAHQVDLYDH